MHLNLPSSWQKALRQEITKPYFSDLITKVETAYETETVYPPPENIFHALELTPLDSVKVVILGQDPYHGPDQAHGLAFSVPETVPTPPSLRNIFKERASDLDVPPPADGNLEHWAKQGVLLLNSTLTVQANQAGSHQLLGWEYFTDAIIKTIASKKESVVFMLWGAYAQTKSGLIDTNKHLILTAPHPSPLSAYRGFLGCKHFSQCNAYLTKHGQKKIKW